jgi:hypothetical protein
MKKALITVVLLVLATFAFAQEYIILCSGSDRGSITILKENNGRVVVNPSLTQGLVTIDSTMCSLLPLGIDFAISVTVQDIIIDGNTSTITYTFGAATRIVVEGNTTTTTYSNGEWEKKVVEGNTTTITYSRHGWDRIIVNGNTTTITHAGGTVDRIVVNGNTTTTTYSNGEWERKVVEGNTTTKTYSSGNWSKKVVNIQGNTIYIHQEGGRPLR